MKINGDFVAKGMIELFRERPELVNTALPETQEAALEAAAVAVILRVAESATWASFDEAPLPVRQLAWALLLDFFSQVMGPRARDSWEVREGASPIEGAYDAIAFEIRKGHPQLA